MFAFMIEETEIKGFMDKLLRGNTFDKLEVRNIELETIIKYEITGNINRDYIEEGEKRYFVKWGEIKNYIFQLVKGDKKPKSLKIVFSLDENALGNLDENAAAAFLNINYEKDTIMGTTGTSQKGFSLDKRLDNAWEDMIKRFFKKNEIAIKDL